LSSYEEIDKIENYKEFLQEDTQSNILSPDYKYFCEKIVVYLIITNKLSIILTMELTT